MVGNLLVWLFGLILGFAIVVFAMLSDEPEDEIFRDDVTEEPIVSPQHTCVECKKKFWSWQMANDTTCIDCYRKRVRK